MLTMKNITYSFIIPHHNTPELLARCIYSIPNRDDVEIIVVDDNSDEDKKACSSRLDVRIIFIDKEHTKGAGHARNVGLEAANGKWLLFADADDFYCDGLLDILDDYKDANEDVVYFCIRSVDGQSLRPIERIKDINIDINRYDGTQEALNRIKFKNQVWNKMYSHSFITDNDITFEEIVCGNDIQFSLLVAYYANAVRIDKRPIYTYTMTANSITTGKMSKEKLLCKLKTMLKIHKFFNEIGFKGKSGLVVNLRRHLRHGRIKQFSMSLYLYFAYYSEIHAEKNKYIDKINQHNR